MFKAIKYIFIFILIFNTGCMIMEPLPKEVYCPAPSQNCKPGQWAPSSNELAVDTTEDYAKFADYYYKFQKVKNINSPANEWFLSFIDRKTATLTFDDGNFQKAIILKFNSDDKGTFSSGIGVPIEGSIGSFSFNKGNVVFSAKESNYRINNKDYLSISNETIEKLNFEDGIYPSSDLYTGKFNGKIISDIKNISKDKFPDVFNWESQPTFSPDGNLIVFSTDLPYKNRGVELWFMVKDKNGNWSEPINCGDSINSSCDEITPFISNDGKKLLFASNGHKTVGGYDIFESIISDALWNDIKNNDFSKIKSLNYFSTPKNLKTPLNTVSDEIYPSSPINPDELLYYSSNQDDKPESIILRKGGFDIYVRKRISKQSTLVKKQDNLDNFEIVNPEIKTDLTIDVPQNILKVEQEYNFSGTVYNAKTEEPVPNADILVKDITPITVEEFDKRKKSKPNLTDRDFELSSQEEGLVYDTFKMKANQEGKYKVELIKEREYEITAQSPELFYETVKIKVDKTSLIKDTVFNFKVPEKLTLRINFPYKVFNEPYKYILDTNGIETDRLWQDEINTLAKNIKSSLHKIKKIILIGHTDDVGSEEYNIKLGLQRVTFIVNQLIQRGVPAEILEYSSKGKQQPLSKKIGEDNNTYRKRLRRVELEKVLN